MNNKLFSLFILLQSICYSENLSHKNSLLTVGEIVEISSDKSLIKVLHRENYDREIKISPSTKLVFFDNFDDVLKKGMWVHAKPNKNGSTEAIYLASHWPKYKALPEDRANKTYKEIFEIVDADKNGSISYIELNTRLNRKSKSGPSLFLRADKDKSGAIEIEEFEDFLNSSVSWWKQSRISPEDWMLQLDRDQSGELTLKELAKGLLSKEGGHSPGIFMQYDKNKSKTWDLKELRAYLPISKLNP